MAGQSHLNPTCHDPATFSNNGKICDLFRAVSNVYVQGSRRISMRFICNRECRPAIAIHKLSVLSNVFV
jgi:hypothetical protein